MEEDDKKEAAAKMIGTSTTDHQKEEEKKNLLQKLPLDSSFLNKLQINEEPSQTETETSSKKRKQVGGDAAMNDSSPNITPKKRKEVIGDGAMKNPSTFPLPTLLPLDSSPSLTPQKRREGPSETTSSQTPTKRRRGRPPGSGSGSNKRKEGPSLTTSQTTSAETPTKRRRGRPPGSGSNKRKEGPSLTTSQTTSAETPTKRRRGRPPGISHGKLIPYIIELNAGQDVVEVLYNISQATPCKTIIILSAFGSVSDIVNLTPDGRKHHKVKLEIHSISINCLVGDDGRHCREKATCTVLCRDDKGILFGKSDVNSLIVADRVRITAALFKTDTAKKTGARISASAATDGNVEKIIPIPAIPLQMIPANFDPAREKEEGSTMLVEGETSGFLPTTPSEADADMTNPTAASTSTSIDQDMKSPSLADNCQDMKSPSVGDT